MKAKGALIILLLAAGLLVYTSVFIVDEREQVVVTQFGKVARDPITEPGLRFKIPFIQIANFFPKNLQEWDGDPGQIPTLDKTFIWVDAFARWRIIDPIKFFQTVNNMISAQGRLDDIIDPAIRNLVTENRLIDTVRNSNRPLDTFELGLEDMSRESGYSFQVQVGREEITRKILEQAQPKLQQFGMELVDVKIKRINYVEQVRQSVYNRMIAERKQIAEKFRSEGRGQAQEIKGEKERELFKIESEAYKTAQEIKGKADAEATKIYAEAFGLDPEFYSFVKSLEIYREAFNENSSMILSTDSKFLRYLNSFEEQEEE
jgi:membrane protease subunit HflC